MNTKTQYYCLSCIFYSIRTNFKGCKQNPPHLKKTCLTQLNEQTDVNKYLDQYRLTLLQLHNGVCGRGCGGGRVRGCA